MANHGQLTKLTSNQRTDIDAGLGRFHFELVKVSWPSPDGVIWYAWENWLADLRAEPSLSALIGSDPLIPAFVASDPKQRFHAITVTSGFGDDVVQMQFDNVGREIERLINKHGSGVKVEFFDHYPEVDGGTTISSFLGTLQTPDNHGDITPQFVNLTAVGGIASADIVIPHLARPQQCPVRFGGQMTAAELPGHPCSYNRHLTAPEQAALGGAKGLLNAGAAFATCPHTEQGCIDRFGHTLVFMGVKTVIDTVPVGAGEHKTYSVTNGRYGSLLEPSSVVYGEREVTGVLLDHRKEVNPSPDHPEAGTLVTLFEFGLGPNQSMTDFKLMERTPQGIDYRLGTQEQTATVFSPNVPSLNRRAVANLNHNPIDPSQVQVEQMKATCVMEGRNTVRVYSDQDTYVESYTNNRAWATLELTENTWFGLNLDRARIPVSDFIYLAGKNVSFNCQVTARSAQQQLSDIFESARWYPPFYHNGQWRFLPIEELDLGAGDIPTFTDTGANRNIVTFGSISTVSALPLNRAKLPNDVFLQFDDADNNNITRPLHFPDWTAQALAGAVYGDNTKRPISKTYTAYGITSLAEAVPLGAFLRDLGPFGHGGLANALEVTFTTKPTFWSEALELHLHKAIKVVSDNLDPAIYLDPNGDPFEYFIVTRLERTNEFDLKVTAIAYGQAYWNSLCAPDEGYVVWDTPDPNVIDGPHGVNTKVLSVDGSCIVTGDTWPDSLDPNDVVVDRVVYTVDMLPTTGVHNITYPSGPLGFKLFADGTAWLYHEGGVDFGVLLPSGSVAAGDTLGMEFDRNGGSPIRRYKHNGVTKLTDTGVVLPENGFALEVDGGVGDQMGDVYWQVYPCTPSDEQQSGEGGGETITGSGSAELIGEPLIGEPVIG